MSSQYQMILGIDNIKKLNLVYQQNEHTIIFNNEKIQVSQIEKTNSELNSMGNKKPNHWVNDFIENIKEYFQSRIGKILLKNIDLQQN